jgi:hypothetical protein
MQDRLFDDHHRVEIDDDHDPYREYRHQAAAIAEEYEIPADEAFSLILSRGSAWAARRALDQRWWFEDDAEAA